MQDMSNNGARTEHISNRHAKQTSKNTKARKNRTLPRSEKEGDPGRTLKKSR
jgi:hypothetical protein